MYSTKYGYLLLVKDHWKGNDPAGEKLLDLLPFFDFNDR